jgi:NADPH:quinone reductase-like Zn-dependent oxidoreductase
MATMHAAVVTSFDEPPHYGELDVPTPGSEHERVVEVLAAGLHPRVRTDASGRHYSSTGTLPMVPGIDGVGRLADGRLVYFVGGGSLPGTMAERAIADERRTVVLEDHADAARLAASMNPAMSSWVALRRRVPMAPGDHVLVLGATGNAGAMAVQVAKHLGAGRVVGAGRDVTRLAALRGIGADEVVQLSDDVPESMSALAAAACEVDTVLDYLWGAPAERAIVALLERRPDRSRALDWIQIGAMAGPTVSLPSVALRSANLRLLGNGQGAVSTETYVAELPSLVEAIEAGTLMVAPRAVPLRDVEAAWRAPSVPGERVVLVP